MKSIGPVLLTLVVRRLRAGRRNRPRARQTRGQRSSAGGGRQGLPGHGRPRGNGPRLLVLPPGTGRPLDRQNLHALSDARAGKALRPRAPEFRQGRIQRSALQRGRRLGDHVTAARACWSRSASRTGATARCATSSTSCGSVSNEPGMDFYSRGSDLYENLPVEIVDITDADGLTVTVYFSSLDQAAGAPGAQTPQSRVQGFRHRRDASSPNTAMWAAA